MQTCTATARIADLTTNAAGFGVVEVVAVTAMPANEMAAANIQAYPLT